jgi:hypothetical protein
MRGVDACRINPLGFCIRGCIRNGSMGICWIIGGCGLVCLDRHLLFILFLCPNLLILRFSLFGFLILIVFVRILKVLDLLEEILSHD